MATYRAELTTKDEVLSYYDSVPDSLNFGFRVFAGSKVDDAYMRFEYLGTNKDEGCAILKDALSSIEQNTANTNIYLLQVIKTKVHGGGAKGRKTRFDGQNITFQLNGVTGIGGVQLYQAPQKTLDFLHDEISQLRLENAELKEQLREYEDEELTRHNEQKKAGGIGAIFSGMLERPEVQDMLVSGVMDFFKNMKNKNSMNIGQSEQKNNISNDAAINAAVIRLSKYVPDLAMMLNKLADIAEKDKGQFDMLLNILRTQNV